MIQGKTKAESIRMWNQLRDKVVSRAPAEVRDEGFTVASGRAGKIETGYKADSREVIEHELQHTVQSGSPTPIDEDVAKIIEKHYEKGNFGPEFSRSNQTADYMRASADNASLLPGDKPLAFEGAPILAETRSYLRNTGLLGDRYDKITVDMLEQAHKNIVKRGKIKNTPNELSGPRFITMFQGSARERREFFKEIVPHMNKVLTTTGAVSAAGVAAKDSKKRGGMIGRRRKRKMRK